MQEILLFLLIEIRLSIIMKINNVYWQIRISTFCVDIQWKTDMTYLYVRSIDLLNNGSYKI